MTLAAPFPYFGGKRKVAREVWRRFGDVANYVEPFLGSGAVLLNRPASHQGHIETVNDKDGYVANFWRAITADPQTVAAHADWPVNENDLHARHAWLVGRRDALSAALEGDPEYYDAKIAGWWVWGMCAWIGSGFCSGTGPWQVVEGKLVHLGDAGRGVNRKRVGIYEWFEALSARPALRRCPVPRPARGGVVSRQTKGPLPGSLVQEWRSCGKPTCRCRTGAKHGPYWRRYWAEGGKVHGVTVKPEDVSAVQACIAAWKQSQGLRQGRPNRLDPLASEHEAIRVGREALRTIKARLR